MNQSFFSDFNILMVNNCTFSGGFKQHYIFNKTLIYYIIYYIIKVYTDVLRKVSMPVYIYIRSI